MVTEKRLIDANALSNAIPGISKDMKNPGAVELACLLMIAEAPTVDAVEAVHGRLIPSIAEVDCTCSVCGSQFDNILSKALAKWNYCPNCGAKMGGGADNGL